MGMIRDDWRTAFTERPTGTSARGAIGRDGR